MTALLKRKDNEKSAVFTGIRGGELKALLATLDSKRGE